MAEKLMYCAQDSVPCKRQSLFKQKSEPLSMTQNNHEKDSPSQMTHSTCNQTIEEILKEKSVQMVERYMNGSEFLLIPNAVDCKDH
eukprot:2751184-Ditylum_brightwellii.AAC.1